MRLLALCLAARAVAALVASPRRRVCARRTLRRSEEERSEREVGEAEGSEQRDVIDMTSPPPKHRDPQCNEAALTDRFLVAARALRGEYDPADAAADTEANSHLLAALVDEYPAPYVFTAVGRLDGGDDERLVERLVAVVRRECAGAVDAVATPRLGGKFASVRLTATVASPEAVRRVFDALRAAPSVKMAF